MLRSLFLFSLALIPGLLSALDTAKLSAIKPAMEAAVAAKQAAGVVTLVMERGKVVHHEAAGMANISKKQPMTKDALFWIASMTKSINATAVMILVDEGKLALDEPASKWLPGLADVKLADGAAPERPITLRLLLSHTAGIAFPPRKATDGAMSLKTYVDSLIKTPLAFQPGSDYEYGFGPSVSGRIIEIASGMGYADFLRTRIFEPLGMKETGFSPAEALLPRIPATYKMDEDRKDLVRAYNPFVPVAADAAREPEPGGGLFSTAMDLGRFYSMIAGAGELDGVRILSAKSVKDMTSPLTAGGRPLTYACGWQVNKPDQRVCAAMPVGSFGHGGAFATNGWVDPASQIVTVYLVQSVSIPESNKPKDSFQRLVMESAGIQVTPPEVAKTKKGRKKKATK